MRPHCDIFTVWYPAQITNILLSLRLINIAFWTNACHWVFLFLLKIKILFRYKRKSAHRQKSCFSDSGQIPILWEETKIERVPWGGCQAMLTFSLQRVYDYAKTHKASEGTHYVLIDRLWPRGIAKAQLEGVEWAKDLAPTPALRQFFHADPVAHWEEFSVAYAKELAALPLANIVSQWKAQGAKHVVLLLGAKSATQNHGLVLQKALEDCVHAQSTKPVTPM